MIELSTYGHSRVAESVTVKRSEEKEEKLITLLFFFDVFCFFSKDSFDSNEDLWRKRRRGRM